MNEQNVFILSENERPPEPNQNQCHGHYRSIQAGGLGHYPGDKCGCEGNVPSAPIDGGIWWLFGFAILLIFVKLLTPTN